MFLNKYGFFFLFYVKINFRLIKDLDVKKYNYLMIIKIERNYKGNNW